MWLREEEGGGKKEQTKRNSIRDSLVVTRHQPSTNLGIGELNISLHLLGYRRRQVGASPAPDW